MVNLKPGEASGDCGGDETSNSENGDQINSNKNTFSGPTVEFLSSELPAVENNLSPAVGNPSPAHRNRAEPRVTGLVHRDSFADSSSFNGSRLGSAATSVGAEVVASSTGELGGQPAHDEPRRMSLLEQKRQQWAAEKAQMNEWNPWGRPGGGAPMNECNKAINSSVDCFSVSTPLQISCGYDDFGRGHGGRLPPLPQAIPSPNNSNFGPFAKSNSSSAASSIGFGHSIIPNHPYDAWKEDIKKQWLEDLEKQREEQHVRKLQEKAYYHKSLANNINVDQDYLQNNLSSTNGGLSVQPSYMPALPTVDENENVQSCAMTVVSHVIESNNFVQSNASLTQRTFLRGANIPLDPQTQSELVKKREKALEQQRAIQFQLEERSRQKQLEKEKRRKEELEEEQRLTKERERLEQSYILEQQKSKLKEEADSQKREAIVEAIYASQKAAKVEKDKRRFAQLPDVVGDTKPVTSIVKEEPEEVIRSKLDSRGPPLLIKDSLSVPSPKTADSPYVHNRVLTPTKFRDKSPATRDFATQTDSYPGELLPLRKNRSTLTAVNIGNEDSDTVFERMPELGLDKRGSSNQQRGKSKNNKKINRQQGRRQQRSQTGTPQDNSGGAGPSPVKRGPSAVESNYYNEWRARQQQQRSKQQQTLPVQQQRTPISRGSEDASRSRAAVRAGERLSGGGTRTRSSAEHQRKIIAQEGVLAATNSQRVCLSPMTSARPAATGSSSTFDECSTAGSEQRHNHHHLPVRKQRRQWESPRRDEMPNFYTDTPNLPDGRKVRRGGNGSDASRRSSEVDEWSSPPLNRHHLPPSQPPLRSASPPVPALRNRHLNQLLNNQNTRPPSSSSPQHRPLGSVGSPVSVASVAQFGSDWLPRRETPAAAETAVIATSPTKRTISTPRSPALPVAVPYICPSNAEQTPMVQTNLPLGNANTSQLSPTHPSIQNSKTFKSSWSLTTPSPEELEEVLHKLTLVRQGLLMKQLEVESLLTNLENTQIEHNRKNI